MFVIGKIQTTHLQWTVGEFTYAYLRLRRACTVHDALIANSSDQGFELYLPPEPRVHVPVLHHNEPIPVRLMVEHNLGLRPEDMSAAAFAVLAKAVMHDAMSEVATRCPKLGCCVCQVGERARTHGLRCRNMGLKEFEIHGMITT